MKTIWLLVTLLLGSVAAHADVLEMKNGDRITGTVDSISGGKVLIVTEYAGAIAVSVDAVASMETEGSFHVRADGGERRGAFATSAEGLQTPEAGRLRKRPARRPSRSCSTPSRPRT